MGFAVACRPDEQDTTLPGNAILFVEGPRGEELDQVIANILLETTTQDQVVEGRPLNILEKVLILLPR